MAPALTRRGCRAGRDAGHRQGAPSFSAAGDEGKGVTRSDPRPSALPPWVNQPQNAPPLAASSPVREPPRRRRAEGTGMSGGWGSGEGDASGQGGWPGQVAGRARRRRPRGSGQRELRLPEPQGSGGPPTCLRRMRLLLSQGGNGHEEKFLAGGQALFAPTALQMPPGRESGRAAFKGQAAAGREGLSGPILGYSSGTLFPALPQLSPGAWHRAVAGSPGTLPGCRRRAKEGGNMVPVYPWLLVETPVPRLGTLEADAVIPTPQASLGNAEPGGERLPGSGVSAAGGDRPGPTPWGAGGSLCQGQTW